MGKKIRHMGMEMTKKEHERWHQEASELMPEKHDALMKKLGITRKEDEEWHKGHLTVHEGMLKGLKPINPFAVGGAFLAWCTNQGWLVQKDKRYFATKEGARALQQYFDIRI